MPAVPDEPDDPAMPPEPPMFSLVASLFAASVSVDASFEELPLPARGLLPPLAQATKNAAIIADKGLHRTIRATSGGRLLYMRAMASRLIARGRTKENLVVVYDQAARAVQLGHPWVFRQGLGDGPTKAQAGELVKMVRTDNSVLGWGIWDPQSPIAIRVLLAASQTNEKQNNLEVIDGGEMLIKRLNQAFSIRKTWLQAFSQGATTAYRMCHGEGDYLPGLVIDRYADVAVIRTDGDGPSAFVENHREQIISVLKEQGLATIIRRDPKKGNQENKTELWFGAAPEDKVLVQEHGMNMIVDVLHGQKTGAFLDQRENRLRVRKMAQNRRVLNLFSYTGGFSLAAALGGAKTVTSVDSAGAAHKTAGLSFSENGLAPENYSWVTADVEVYLGQALQRGQKWDLIICDPPSYAPNERSKERALQAYRRLHGACAAVLDEGGILCAASCSSHVHGEDFLRTLDRLSLRERSLRLMEFFGSPWDHPTLASWPEGQYLKFAILW